MYVIVFYDVRDDGKRLKIMKRLLALGFSRLQKSVYVRKGSRGDAKDAFNATVKYLGNEDRLFIIVVSDKEFREAWRVEGEAG